MWQALPATSIILLLLLSALPGNITALTSILAALPLLALFYWTLTRPGRLSLVFIMCAGLLQDVLLSTPFGLNAVLWVLFRLLIVTQRKQIVGQGFVVAWVSCGLMLFAVLALQCLAVGFNGGQRISLAPVLMQWAISVLLYPGLHAFLTRIERRFYRKYWHILRTA